jgi:hypothetical protein
MRLRRRPFAAVAGMLLAATAFSAAPVAAGGTDTWYVAPPTFTSGQSSGGSCASPDFTDIQTAVDAAGPFDTIILCNGTYPVDAVVIQGYAKRGLTLKAKNKWQATLKALDSGFRSGLIEIRGTREVTIQHLRFLARGQNGCTSGYPGAAIDAGSVKNVDIRGNRIISPPGAVFTNFGFDSGIWLDDTTGVVRYNLVQDWGYIGILTQANDDPGTLRIIGNSLRYRHAGIEGRESAGGTGIYVHDGEARTFKINHNKVLGLATAGTEPTGTTPMLGQGIYLEGEVMTVLNNEVRRAELGLFAYDYPKVGVRRNTALRNRIDCSSDVLSPRWVDNIGRRSDPVGLCTPPAS